MASNSTFFTRDASFSFGMEDQLWFGGRGVGGARSCVLGAHPPPRPPQLWRGGFGNLLSGEEKENQDLKYCAPALIHVQMVK